MSTVGGIVKVVKSRDESVDVGALLGLLSAARGIGAVASGPMTKSAPERESLGGPDWVSIW